MSLQAKHIKAEFKTSEGSSVLKWEHHPISAAHAQENNSSSHAKSSSSSSTAAAPEAKSPAVLATVKTTVPPGCRTQNINGLCGAIYAVPRLALVETSPASSTSQKPASYIVMNCHDNLYIFSAEDPNGDPVHTVNFSGVCPSCHASRSSPVEARDDHDYAVGLSTGVVLSFSMGKHLEANTGGGDATATGSTQGKKGGGNGKGGQSSTSVKVAITGVQQYNWDKAGATGRCTAVAWSPRKVSMASVDKKLDVLVAAFADGSLHLYSPNGEALSTLSTTPHQSPSKTLKDQSKHSSSMPTLGSPAPIDGSNSNPGSHSQTTTPTKDSQGHHHHTNSSSFFSSLSRKGLGQSEVKAEAHEGQTPKSASAAAANLDGDSLDSSVLIAQWSVSSCAINAVAFSQNGYQLACVSYDGILRIFDAATGSLRAGCRSYFGGYLSVSWSQDGRFVIAGGEDDLVEIFSIEENAIVAFGDGHKSWVSGLCFLSVTDSQADSQSPNSAVTAAETTIYKFASVGQDGYMLLWEFEAPSAPLHDGRPYDWSLSPHTPRHRRWISSGGTNSTPISIAIPPIDHQETVDDTFGGACAGDDIPMSDEGERSVGEHAECHRSIIAPSPSRSQMVMMAPTAQHQVHLEPLSSILCCGQGDAIVPVPRRCG